MSADAQTEIALLQHLRTLFNDQVKAYEAVEDPELDSRAAGVDTCIQIVDDMIASRTARPPSVTLEAAIAAVEGLKYSVCLIPRELIYNIAYDRAIAALKELK